MMNLRFLMGDFCGDCPVYILLPPKPVPSELGSTMRTKSEFLAILLNFSVMAGASIAAEINPAVEEVLRAFVAAVDEGNFAEAIGLLDPSATVVPEQRNQWEAQFSAIESIRIIRADASETAATTGCLAYKVLLDVQLDAAAAAAAAIPNYGWDQNLNTRWFEMCLKEGSWRISAIGTGP